MKNLVSIFIWILVILYASFFLIFALGCTYLFPVRIYDPLLKKMLRFTFFLLGSSVEMEGRHYAAPGATYLFMANHVSLFDLPLLAGFIPGSVRGVEAHSHFSWPLYGWVTKRLGNIPINRESIQQSVGSMRKVQSLLESGHSMIILPEGHRTLDGQTKPFKTLPFAMVKQTNTGIIPIGLSGLYDLKRKGSWKISPSKIKISLGPEITKDQIAGFSAPELRDYVQNEIARLIEKP
jgi:1-acyl-sn-glycerol-3-phosphate acyltransferase